MFCLILLILFKNKDIVLRHAELHPSLVSPSHQTPKATNSSTVVEDCEVLPASPSPICKGNGSTPLINRETKKTNGKLLTRSKSAGVTEHTQPTHTVTQYYSHVTPPRPHPSPLHHTVNFSRPSKPQVQKPIPSPSKQKNIKEQIDLTVTSARMVSGTKRSNLCLI